MVAATPQMVAATPVFTQPFQQYSVPAAAPEMFAGYGAAAYGGQQGFGAAGQSGPGYGGQQVPAYGGQAGQFQPRGYQNYPPRMVRPARPNPRENAICYNCGMEGHFTRDGVCLQANVDAFQALLRAQQAGVPAGAAAAAAAGGVQPAGGLQAIGFQGPAAPGGN